MSSAFFKVEDVFFIMGMGTVVVGRVQGGEITKGMKGKVGKKSTEVVSIEKEGREIPVAKEGDYCGLLLRGISEKEVKKGEVIYFE